VIRILDIFISAAGLFVAAPLLGVLYVVGWCYTGSPIFRQERVGRYQRPFELYKFRTMLPETPQVATHLVATAAVTPFGRVLRRTKLDELPQLWNVLRGDMSLVGPRPCLFSQKELIRTRLARGIFDVRPGITGLAQVNGVDMSDPARLAALDAEMLQQLTVPAYVRYIMWTVTGRGAGDQVRG
jgi:lipopolysaccharide/colanic/teichoic acid biosynthesis glycosyltransferase